jgi:glutamine amidotransferase
MDVLIIDSGGANLASLQFAIERLGRRAEVTADPQAIARARRIILPGVGSAADAMQRLRKSGIAEILPSLTQPVLGICLGMQLLFTRSEEGSTACLGILPGEVQRLRAQPGRPVPHMGWNRLDVLRPDPLLEGISASDYVYFVHSYAAPVGDLTLAAAEYGMPLSAVIRKKNFWGTQFHPERSGPVGARILSNFLGLSECC